MNASNGTLSYASKAVERLVAADPSRRWPLAELGDVLRYIFIFSTEKR